MSKIYKIRWQQSDHDDLRKAVKNFNAKITRLEKKYPEQKRALPERMTVKQIRALITSRQDLKRELNALRRFTTPGAEQVVDVPDSEYNLKITKWQKDEMSRRVAGINRKRKERYDVIKDVEVQSRGEKLGYTVGEAREAIGMGSVDANSTKPMNAFTEKMTRTDLHYKFRSILRESQLNYWNEREQIMKDTYIDTLLENFSKDDITGVLAAIEHMDFRTFYKNFSSDAGKWESLYPNKGGSNDDYKSYLEGLRATWTPSEVKEKYMESLLNEYGDDANEIVKAIESMDSNTFFTMYYEHIDKKGIDELKRLWIG